MEHGLGSTNKDLERSLHIELELDFIIPTLSSLS